MIVNLMTLFEMINLIRKNQLIISLKSQICFQMKCFAVHPFRKTDSVITELSLTRPRTKNKLHRFYKLQRWLKTPKNYLLGNLHINFILSHFHILFIYWFILLHVHGHDLTFIICTFMNIHVVVNICIYSRLKWLAKKNI